MNHLWSGRNASRIFATLTFIGIPMALVIGYGVGRVRAADIPQTNTLTYTGSLLAFGQPDNATHQMYATLYANGSTTAACGSTAGSITTVNGQFTIPLPPACVPIVHQYQNLQVQVTVDGSALGLSSVTAVPYAVEADTASVAAVGSTLATSIAAATPPGTIVPTAATSCPAGTLPMNGASYATTGAYAGLFAAIGYTYGGSGASFNVPNAQGVFLRGAGSQGIGGISYTGTQGTTQNDALASHTHNNGAWTSYWNGSTMTFAQTAVQNAHPVPVPNVGWINGYNTYDGLTSASGSGSETRPANISVLYCIWYL